MRNQKGFTLVELVVVIVLLGILSAVAIPKFIDIQTEAEEASADGVFGAAQSAASLNHAAKLVGKAVTDRPAYNAGTCATGEVDNGACLLQAIEEVPSGWAASGGTIAATVSTVTYTITVTTAETGTTKAILSKSW